MELREAGCEWVATGIDAHTREQLRSSLFNKSKVGTRCLLDVPQVRQTAVRIRQELIASGHLPPEAVAIQAIAFDKTPDTNWKVTWHQDLMFPFAKPVRNPGFELPCIKDGIDYARPPTMILEGLLAVRLHLDDCDENNGPLRVITGSHRNGILSTAEIAARTAQAEPLVCVAQEGVALLMRPMLLHASSKALEPKHRRVLHFVYAPANPAGEEWYRSVS